MKTNCKLLTVGQRFEGWTIPRCYDITDKSPGCNKDIDKYIGQLEFLGHEVFNNLVHDIYLYETPIKCQNCGREWHAIGVICPNENVLIESSYMLELPKVEFVSIEMEEANEK